VDLTPSRDGPRVNDEITAMQIRLVDERGTMIGVTALREALDRAAEAGLDLVEIAPTADPPVCKILDYGKFKYEEQKKKNEARKKQKVIEIKEIKLRPTIDDNDYNIKMRAMQRFLEEGDKVKVTSALPRPRARPPGPRHGRAGPGPRRPGGDRKVEQMPKMEGRQMVMVVAPK